MLHEEISKLNRSFIHAARGIRYAVKFERNFRIELIMACFVAALIPVFRVKNWEAIVLILMISWVLAIELLNTVLERVVDILKPRIHPYARLIKDIMAAVVLISSIAAFIIGLIIFLPYFLEFFSNF